MSRTLVSRNRFHQIPIDRPSAGYLNTVTMSPNSSLCASGGKGAKAMLWDLNDGKHLYTLDLADTINVLTFSSNRCVHSQPAVRIFISSSGS